MSIKIQNLSNFKVTNFLTVEKTSSILGGFSHAQFNLPNSRSLFLNAALEDLKDLEIGALSDRLNSGKSEPEGRRQGKKNKLNTGNVRANNVVFGTPGNDVLIGS